MALLVVATAWVSVSCSAMMSREVARRAFLRPLWS